MSTPPPYANITGIFTTDDKHQQVTLANYDGNARPGQLVIDSATYQLYVGNADGNLNLVTAGSGSSPAGANTQLQFNDAGSFGASGGLTFNKTSNTLGIGVQAISGNATSLTFSGSMTGNGAGLTNLSPANMVGMPSATTLLVDPDGNDVTGDGSDNKPFATVQVAHDYAAANIASTAYVAIKLNAGSYAGNVTLTRPRTAIVGASDGLIRSSWITGSVTVNMTTGASSPSADIFAIQNLIITSNDASVITLGGDQRYVFFSRNVQGYTSGASSNVLSVTNTSVGGLRVDLLNTTLQSDGGGTVLSTTNTYYLNINASTIIANSGAAMSATTTSGLIATTRISTESGSNTVLVTSAFAPGAAMTFGICTFESTTTNGNGIYIAAGATVALGGCAFDVPTGTGFAVAGQAGSVLVKSANNNQIAYNTNGATQGTVTVVPMSYL